MADPYLGEIRMMAFNYAPSGWATCDGQVLNINQNQALYTLLGTFYGGNGSSTFALPDLRGRTIMGVNGANWGEKGGSENVVLTTPNLPAHNHQFAASNQPANTVLPASTALSIGNIPNGANTIYATSSDGSPMNPAAVSNAGTSAGHNNMQPSLVINFCIALTGIYPMRQ